MRIRRLLIFAVFLIIVALVALYALVAMQGYNILTSPGQHDLSTIPPGVYEDVSFPSRSQHYKVHAGYMPGRSCYPALISVHGHKGSRHDSYHLDRAVALRDLGYTVLSVDLKDNGGDTVDNGHLSMGYRERYDVLGGFDY